MNTPVTQDEKTIQKYNVQVKQFVELMKLFVEIALDSPKIHYKVNTNTSDPKGFHKPVVDFYANNLTTIFLSTLKKYGFPDPVITGHIATFNRIDFKVIISNKVVPDAINADVLNTIYDDANKFIKNKGLKTICWKGKNFIRVYDLDFTKKVSTFLKSKYSHLYKFDRYQEDIFVLPINSKVESSTETTWSDIILKVIEDLCEVQIADSIPGADRLIVGFGTEEQMEKAAGFCTEFYGAERKGTTLIFKTEKGKKFDPFEDVAYYHEAYLAGSFNSSQTDSKVNSETTPSVNQSDSNTSEKNDSNLAATSSVVKKGHTQTATGETSLVVEENLTEKIFNHQVREYCYDLGYEPLDPTSMRQLKPYVYTLGLQGDLAPLIAKIIDEKPEWIVSRATSESKWLKFKHVLLAGGKNKKQPEVPKAKSSTEPVIDFPILSENLISKIERFQRAVNAPKAKIIENKEALDLIAKIGKKFGITYDTFSPRLKTGYPSCRTTVWKDKYEKLEKTIPFFEQLGYEVKMTNKYLFFNSIFPAKKDLNFLRKSDSAAPVIKAEPEKVISKKVESKLSKNDAQPKSGISITFELTTEQEEKLFAQFATKLIDLSDEDLIEEIKRRGKPFASKLFVELFGS